MMTMLHSVWSGGGSAAGRRRSLLALGALLALIASVLIWATPTQAQNLTPPVAQATIVTEDESGNPLTDTNTGAPIARLDGSGSVDPDGLEGEGTLTYEWELLTDAYSWIRITGNREQIATFPIPDAEAAAQYGQVIEFRLTVTDDDTPSASDSAIVAYNLNQNPTADIAVEANLLDETSTEEGTDAYTIDAVIDGPGENGNAVNEWDIMEGALLVLDGSGSSDPNGTVEGYDWVLLHPENPSHGFKDEDADDDDTEQLSTDNDDGDPVETIANISADDSPYYAYYTLQVTDNDDDTSQRLVVKIAVHDQPAAPEVKLIDENRDVADDNPIVVAGDDPPAQKVLLPLPTPRWVVNPGVTVTVATEVTDADGDETVIDYEWSTGEAPEDDSTTTDVDESKTKRIVEVPEDAEDGTIITVTLTATDSSGLTGEASADLLVVEGNTVPIAEIEFNGRPAGLGQPAQIENIVPPTWGYNTLDGLAGGDGDENGEPTGRITISAWAFDPDQPENTLLMTWNQIDEATEDLVDPDIFKGPILDLEFPEPGTVSFEVPEVGTTTSDTGTLPALTVAFSAIDQHGVGGVQVVRVILEGASTKPWADAGDDQIVQPESFVRLAGIRSSDPDKGDSIASYDWSLTNVVTTPDTKDVPSSLQEQVFDELRDTWIVDIDTPQSASYNNNITSDATSAYPSFTAPKVPDGITDIQVTFTLEVTDQGGLTDTDSVTVTVTNGFFSGIITGPSFCSNLSLGGPTTYAFDSDGDGVADICSLRTTRRATVARQNALETLVALTSHLTFNVTDSDFRTSSATFADLIIGRNGTDGVPPVIPAVSTIVGTCNALGLDELGDSEADLAADACSTGRVSDPPPPVDPTVADEFFSGVITGPNFCTNLSLGGPRTYAFDSDDDGVADLCSLPYTRREAVARQNAMEIFVTYSQQYDSALAAACTALGNTDFGDDEADLAADECVVPPDEVEFGDPLPTPTS